MPRLWHELPAAPWDSKAQGEDRRDDRYPNIGSSPPYNIVATAFAGLACNIKTSHDTTGGDAFCSFDSTTNFKSCTNANAGRTHTLQSTGWSST